MSIELKNFTDYNNFMGTDKPFKVIYVYDDKCGPCEYYGPQYEKIAMEYKFIPFAKTNKNVGIIRPYALPTTVIVSNKGVLNQIIGPEDRALRQTIYDLLKKGV